MTEAPDQENDVTGLPHGFRRTALGPLPEEWKLVRLRDIAVFTRRPKGLTLKGRVAFIPMELIPNSGLSKPDYRLIEPDELRSGVYCEPGDIVLARITPCFENGKQAIVPDDLQVTCFTSTEVFPLKTNPHAVERDFLFHYLRLSHVRQQIAARMEGTTGRQRIPRQTLTDLLLPLPTPPEQRAVARVLHAVELAMAATERVIQATRELKRSLMRHLFTYGPVPIEQVGRVPLKETEIGFVPEHWETVRLGEVALVKGGKRLPKGHKFACRPTPYPYVRVADFKDGSVEKANLRFLTPQDHEAIKQYTISSRDVYISIAGTIGLVGVIPPELDGANLTENAARIILKDYARIEQRFLHYFLSSKLGQEQISLRTTKTSQPKLALARIKEIVLPLPAPEEQRKLACILEAADKKLKAEEAKKQALKTLSKTLLHNLMTGKIRVSDLALSESEGVV